MTFACTTAAIAAELPEICRAVTVRTARCRLVDGSRRTSRRRPARRPSRSSAPQRCSLPRRLRGRARALRAAPRAPRGQRLPARSGCRYACCASYVPQSSRRTPQISPTVHRARRASRMGGRRFASVSAATRTSASDRAAASPSRSARTRAVRSHWRCSIAGSTCRSSTSPRCSSTNAFTPTTTRSPDSTSVWSGTPRSSISAWTKPCSIAATAPPSSSMRVDQLARALG